MNRVHYIVPVVRLEARIEQHVLLLEGVLLKVRFRPRDGPRCVVRCKTCNPLNTSEQSLSRIRGAETPLQLANLSVLLSLYQKKTSTYTRSSVMPWTRNPRWPVMAGSDRFYAHPEDGRARTS